MVGFKGSFQVIHHGFEGFNMLTNATNFFSNKQRLQFHEGGGWVEFFEVSGEGEQKLGSWAVSELVAH